ncbi:uncharacterized protein GO595_004280 [Histomonas meleagridis]|uniref:uncharacterized protein n=1 Tax=Histomonas meleagridis TaxID=135588 RepID=UPI00355A0B0D|nr:hypothetical protein GO595_004280 [Histomonas meleagridis]
MKMYKELKQRNETLRNNIQHPNSHVTLQMSKVFRTTISAVPNPIEVFKLKQYNYSNSSTQTEVTGRNNSLSANAYSRSRSRTRSCRRTSHVSQCHALRHCVTP